ncbi:MAG: ribosomal RNA small subunit methyltransferase A [Elusimicrobia bacterium]|nr:ribosomal RNA small subunit methyltransferase A [Elusimicrobiota bacterium]
MSAKLGQHFLVDASVRDAILAAASLSPEDAVVEIGPGRGFLTRELARRSRLTAVEMDERLAEALGREPAPGFRLVRSDFLKVDLAQLGPPPLKFVANLPYAVATPILQRLLSWDCWSLAVLMFQREVAERILAGPGSRDYGVLTLSVAIKAEARLVAAAPPGSFSPPPRVHSAVVRLDRRARPRLSPEDERPFFKVVRAAFRERRKTAANSLGSALGIGRGAAAASLERCGVPAGARAEDIPLEAFVALARELGGCSPPRGGGE